MTTDMATDSTTTANTAWVQLDQAVECQACGQPTNRTLAGVPVHRGECATIVDVPDEQGSPVEPASTSANTPATLQSEPPVRPLPTRPAGGPESWTDLDHRAPCAVCGIPAIRALDGVPLHMGECVEALPAAEPTEAVTEAVSEAVSDVVTASVHAQDVEQSDVKPDEPQDGDQAKAPRWQAPVAVLDEEQVYLPGGQTADWPEYAHLGDLAMLAHRDQLRLGHGGGETLPEPGQIWITSPATLARLGLPEELELPDGIDQMDIRTSREVIKEALSAYADLPPVADAVAAGWEIGDLDGWVYLRHPDELTQGARLVFIPWIHDRLREVALLSQAGSETELADNLAEAAHAMGVQYLIHSGITAHRLINDTRPPRRDADDISGSNAKRIAVVRDTKSELPSFYRRAHDSRFEPDLGDSFKATESDLSWWRPWNLVDEATRARKYVHAYDRKASYLVEWGSCDLGVEDLVHRPEGEATWDGTERAGLWLIDKDWGDWPEPYLPEPYWDSVVAGKDEDSRRVWVTTPTLVLLGKVGITPNVVESYTWGVSTRYLEQAAERLRPMRVHHNPAVAAFAKQVYAVGTGRFGRTDGAYSSDPLWRPDWYDHIRASARLKIMITLLGIKNSTHITPLAAGRDSIVFASDERDPIAAWPGNPKRLGNEPGMWAPEASGLLADWGKEHLPERKRQLPNHGRWNSTKAIDALTSHKRGGTW